MTQAMAIGKDDLSVVNAWVDDNEATATVAIGVEGIASIRDQDKSFLHEGVPDLSGVFPASCASPDVTDGAAGWASSGGATS